MLLYIVPTGHQGRDSPTLTGALKEGKIIIIIIIIKNTTQHNAHIILISQY